MQTTTDKIAVKVCEQYGRYAVATKDLKAGELILLERPVILGPGYKSPLCCLNCFRESNLICQRCNQCPLCIHCKSHDPDECELLQNMLKKVDKNFLIENFDIITTLRLLLIRSNPKKQGLFEELLRMESHITERRNMPIWKYVDDKIVKPMISAGIVNKNEEELVQTLCGILDTNRFDLRGPKFPDIAIGGIFPRAALMAHSCIPNTLLTTDEEYNLRIYASVPIAEDEAIFYNYTNPLYGTTMRQIHLNKSKCFICNCRRCQDPTEMGTHLSSLNCTKCNKGFVIASKGSLWKCDQCVYTLNENEVNKLIAAARIDITANTTTIMTLDCLIQKYSQLLNPNHYIVIEMKQDLAAKLKSLCENPVVKPPKWALERKVQLCRELLPTIETLLPGISRLRGILLYEMTSPMMSLAEMQRDDGDVSDVEYLSTQIEAASLLKQSISHMMYEPVKSPEGQLQRQIMFDLKELRLHIQELEKIKN